MQALARRAAAPIFALALFSSAGLIFVLQPLFARMATPLLGGSPAVWNTSMAFSSAPLGGYSAHLLARVKDLRAGCDPCGGAGRGWLVLPVHVTDLLGPPSSEHPALCLLAFWRFPWARPSPPPRPPRPAATWFARTGRADAHDPYYLYAASNLGSFTGLLAYPV